MVSLKNTSAVPMYSVLAQRFGYDQAKKQNKTKQKLYRFVKDSGKKNSFLKNKTQIHEKICEDTENNF